VEIGFDWGPEQPQDKITGMSADTVPVHLRSMEFEATTSEGAVTVVGRLRDRRPWATGADQIDELHDITLSITVDVATLTIQAAEVEMDRYPHTECPLVIPAFQGLVGLSVTRGYVRAVQERFAGPAGCTHVDQLARAMGPVVVQAVTSMRSRDRDWNAFDQAPRERPTTFPRNSCHVWREGGPAEQKLAAGWRPGVDGYPAPPVAHYLPTPERRDPPPR
jgi:hypothetical protein